MKIFSFVLACLMLNFLTAGAQRQAKPELIKLPFAFPQQNRTPMENTPVWFDSSLLLVSNYRPGGAFAKGENAYLYVENDGKMTNFWLKMSNLRIFYWKVEKIGQFWWKTLKKKIAPQAKIFWEILVFKLKMLRKLRFFV